MENSNTKTYYFTILSETEKNYIITSELIKVNVESTMDNYKIPLQAAINTSRSCFDAIFILFLNPGGLLQDRLEILYQNLCIEPKPSYDYPDGILDYYYNFINNKGGWEEMTSDVETIRDWMVSIIKTTDDKILEKIWESTSLAPSMFDCNFKRLLPTMDILSEEPSEED